MLERETAQINVYYGTPEGGKPRLQVETRPLPDLAEGEILARVCLATICGSDLHTLSGKRTEPTPGVLGHEAVAEVVRSNREGVGEGLRISFSIADSCSACHLCRVGMPQKCTQLFKYGHALVTNRSGLNGCYATHILIRSGTHVAKVPNHVTDKMAAPANCALATAVCAIDKIYDPDNSNRIALVQGAGLMGLYACALLKESGYQSVYCADVSAERLALVPCFGGIPVLPGNPDKRIEDNAVDVVLEMCGAKSVFKEGIRVLRPGGTYVLIGMVHPDSGLNLTGEQLIRKCLTITGIHNYAPRHLDEAIDFLSRTADKYPYEDLVGQEWELDDFQQALDDAVSRKYVRVGLRINKK